MAEKDPDLEEVSKQPLAMAATADPVLLVTTGERTQHIPKIGQPQHHYQRGFERNETWSVI